MVNRPRWTRMVALWIVEAVCAAAIAFACGWPYLRTVAGVWGGMMLAALLISRARGEP